LKYLLITIILFSSIYSQDINFEKYNKEFEDGSFLKYSCFYNEASKDTNILLEWGNDKYSRYDTTYNNYRPPSFHWKNNDYIYMSFGCGSPCWGSFFLPLDKNKNKQSFMYQYDVDSLRNLVAYLDFDDDMGGLAIIHDLNEEISDTILLPKCLSAFPGYCIVDYYLKNDSINLTYDPKATFDSTVKTINLSRKINLK